MNPIGKMFIKLHVGLYRASGGMIGGTLVGQKVLVLTTRGNKSGKERSVALLYFVHEGKSYIVASAGGAPAHPAWYKNLLANPVVTVERGKDKRQVRAVTVDEAERAPVWEMIKRVARQFAGYEQKAAGRVIPLVRLDEVASA